MDSWNDSRLIYEKTFRDLGSGFFMKQKLKKLEDLKNFLDQKDISYPKSWNTIFKKKKLKKRKLILAPDCGLGFLPRKLCLQKLKIITKVAKSFIN